MCASKATGTRRVRRMKRNAQRLRRDGEWLLKRLGVESDPERLTELREALQELGQSMVPIESGTSLQESRLPKAGGPDDCVLCHMSIAVAVPVSEQRIFEDGLRQNPGATTEWVYDQPEFKPEHPGTGRGWISVTRSKHSEHAADYPKWRTTPSP